MSTASKPQVLKAFKQLHQTCKKVFNGDDHTLNAARLKINDEFKKNKHVTEPKSVQELVNLATAVEHEIRSTVVQAVETKPGVYSVKLTPDTQTFENIPFDENITPAQLKKSLSAKAKCCKTDEILPG